MLSPGWGASRNARLLCALALGLNARSVDVGTTPRSRGLHVQSITQVPTKRTGRSGKVVAANRNFVCYAVRDNLIRVVDNEAPVGVASPAHDGVRKALLRGHECAVVDMAFACALRCHRGVGAQRASVWRTLTRCSCTACVMCSP